MPPEDKILKPTVVLDTNVFISALNFKGKPREILDLIRMGEMKLYTSPFILDETKRILRDKFDWATRETKNAIARIRDRAVEVQPKLKISIIKEKDDDNRILECAVEGKVQYLISGDTHHILPLKKYQGIKILSPAQFLFEVF